MPSRHTRKPRAIGAFHIYNRGRDGCAIFEDDADREKFADIFNRYLTPRQSFDSRGRALPSFASEVQLHARCLMTTHFHKAASQSDPDGIERFMHAGLSAYVRYFNRRHNRNGPLFAGPYRARLLESPNQFKWAVSYVHDNHPTGLDYRFSTHRYYAKPDDAPAWLNVEQSLRVFGGPAGYDAYLRDRRTRNRLDIELR